jgi:methyl-accepting chemotaxis protein/hemerythrin
MSIKHRVILSILAIFIVILGMFITTWMVTASQKTDSLVINLAGRQRMLMQMMTKQTLAHVLAVQKGAAEQGLKDAVQKTKVVFEATQNALQNSGQAPLTLDPAGPNGFLPVPSAAVRDQLTQVQRLWTDYAKSIAAVLADNSEVELQKLLAADPALLQSINKAVGLLQQESEAKVSRLLMIMAGGAVFAALAVALALLTMQRGLIGPLGRIRDFALQIRSGNLNAAMSGDYKKEVLVLKEAVQDMVQSLKQNMEKARIKGEEAERGSIAVQEALEEARQQENKVKELVERMIAAAGKARNVSERVFAGIGELSGQVETVSKGVAVQSDRMGEIATAMEEMNTTVLEVAKNASRAAEQAERSKENAETGAEEVRRTVESFEHIRERVFALKETMGQLGLQVENIGKIMTVISDIADQTNLLALNAAIEAARAGEAGRGFSVVADEVRKLAEKTMSATVEVRSAVDTIQSQTRKNIEALETTAADIVASTEAAAKSGRSMQEIVTIVEETASMVASIATAAEEQSATSEEINRAVAEVSRIASESAEGMDRSARALVEIASQVEELDTVTQAISGQGSVDMVDTDRGDALIRWTKDLSVGVESIDEQHKILVDMINELHAAMKMNRSKETLLEIFDRLRDYTVNHFGHEEKLFQKHGYPEVQEHLAAHKQFVAKVLEWEAAIKSGRATVSMEIMRFLKQWLTGHIMGLDKRYGPFLVQNGVR